jgi:hypothetical protein
VRRLPAAALGVLVLATVAAFFFTQHLKVTTPLIAGDPHPSPVVIDPLNGTICGGVNDRQTIISFYLLHRADVVDVYVVDQTGAIVRTIAVGRHMRRGVRVPDGVFRWNGREDDGRVAPDGQYHFRVALLQQGRTIDLQAPVTVKTTPPEPVVTSAKPALISQGRGRVTIDYAGNQNRGGTIRVYRTDLPGRPQLAKSFLTPWKGHTAVWDGMIHRRPAPAGTYLIGLDVSDAACNTGHFPPVMPPLPGTTPHAGVTVRYLAAEPPLTPAPAGSRILVHVDSKRLYRWSLFGLQGGRPLAVGASDQAALRVPLPPKTAGLYQLSLHSGAHSTTVPVVVAAARPQRVLVVLPALTWQGRNPVDDTGDGLPSTLDAGGPITLDRPLVDGLPAGFADEAGLLGYLGKTHRAYDLTTDLALTTGIGPRLAAHTLVLLAGSERWLPPPLGAGLRSYVEGGGHLVSLGIESMRREVTLEGDRALNPTAPATVDALGATHGAPVSASHDLTIVIRDQLGIFATGSGALAGHSAYEPITSVAAPARALSEAGVTYTSPSIVGYRLGRGVVVEIGLEGFGSSLAHNFGAQELVDRVWSVLGG